jgi:electron transfer flavoprotein alpha subunit
MAILVIAEHDHNSIKAATLNAVTAATKIGGEISTCWWPAALAPRPQRQPRGWPA